MATFEADFYENPDNIVGFAFHPKFPGSFKHATIYFYDGENFGKITQYDSDENKIGRSVVRTVTNSEYGDFIYSIENMEHNGETVLHELLKYPFETDEEAKYSAQGQNTPLTVTTSEDNGNRFVTSNSEFISTNTFRIKELEKKEKILSERLLEIDDLLKSDKEQMPHALNRLSNAKAVLKRLEALLERKVLSNSSIKVLLNELNPRDDINDESLNNFIETLKSKDLFVISSTDRSAFLTNLEKLKNHLLSIHYDYALIENDEKTNNTGLSKSGIKEKLNKYSTLLDFIRQAIETLEEESQDMTVSIDDEQILNGLLKEPWIIEELSEEIPDHIKATLKNNEAGKVEALRSMSSEQKTQFLINLQKLILQLTQELSKKERDIDLQEGNVPDYKGKLQLAQELQDLRSEIENLKQDQDHQFVLAQLTPEIYKNTHLQKSERYLYEELLGPYIKDEAEIGLLYDEFIEEYDLDPEILTEDDFNRIFHQRHQTCEYVTDALKDKPFKSAAFHYIYEKAKKKLCKELEQGKHYGYPPDDEFIDSLPKKNKSTLSKKVSEELDANGTNLEAPEASLNLGLPPIKEDSQELNVPVVNGLPDPFGEYSQELEEDLQDTTSKESTGILDPSEFILPTQEELKAEEKTPRLFSDFTKPIEPTTQDSGPSKHLRGPSTVSLNAQSTQQSMGMGMLSSNMPSLPSFRKTGEDINGEKPTGDLIGEDSLEQGTRSTLDKGRGSIRRR